MTVYETDVALGASASCSDSFEDCQMKLNYYGNVNHILILCKHCRDCLQNLKEDLLKL